MIDNYKFDSNSPSFYEDEFPKFWQMTRWEKLAFIGLVNKINPEVAIEIGNAQGGSLQVLSKVCKKVYALDFSNEVHGKLKNEFTKNVEFHTGDSKVLLPEILKKIELNGDKLGFILIDGDHSTEGVRADINSVLNNYIPIVDLYIIFHDSFNPICRKGIITADWTKNDYVHFVDIDFLPGNFFKDKYHNSEKGSIWGGLSLAVLKPQKRVGELIVRESLQPTYNLMFKSSRYNQITYRLRRFFNH